MNPLLCGPVESPDRCSSHDAHACIIATFEAEKIVITAPRESAVSLLPTDVQKILPMWSAASTSLLENIVPERHFEFTWLQKADGPVPLPLRPTLTMAGEILAACRDESDRPIPWCLIDRASPATAHLMDRLVDSWGQGIACLSRTSHEGTDHGLPRDEATLIQQSSALRVWWGSRDYLDPFLILESLRHGCLPLQCVAAADYAPLASALPPGLRHFLLPLPAAGVLPTMTRQERDRRLDVGLSVILAGSLERDLATALKFGGRHS